jgi:uncharacterized integral membrane protein
MFDSLKAWLMRDDVQDWEFWHPSSGAIGGILAGVVVGFLIVMFVL